MKRKLWIVAFMLTILVNITGCSQDNNTETLTSNEEQVANEQQTTTEDAGFIEIAQDGGINLEKIGVKASMPDTWKEDSSNIYKVVLEQSVNPDFGLTVNFITDEALMASETAQDKIWENSKPLFNIVIIRDDMIKEEELAELIAGPEKKVDVEKISTLDKYTYYFCTFQYDDTGLSDESKQKYKALYDGLESIKNSIQISAPKEAVEAVYPSQITFTTQDMEGTEVTNEVFKNNKITMINIWATYCGPCLVEMPDIQVISEELKEQGVGVIGIAGDTADSKGNVDEETLQLAKSMLEAKGISYMNLVMNKDLLQIPAQSYPTTIFVDSNGNMVGDAIIGAMSKEKYIEYIQKALESVQ